MPAPEASGRAFLGLINQIKDQHGAAMVKTVLASLPAAHQTVFSSRLLHGSWYSYAAYVALLKAAAQRCGHGTAQAYRTLGSSSGTRDLNTVFRIYIAIASTERLIRGCARVWESYYRNAGTMEAVRWAPEDTMLRITGFPQMAPEHCLLMEGWMITTMKTLGAEVIEPRESMCSSRGGDAHEFSCRWRKS